MDKAQVSFKVSMADAQSMNNRESAYYALTRKEGRWDSFPGHEVVSYIREKFGNGSSLLDLGCGTAGILENLPPNINYTGIDSSEYAIREAEEKWHRRPNTRFILHKETDLSLAEESFDAVLLFFFSGTSC
jgi:ubiquinone/menaquinone biosynthesis C-methylase UbiE